MMSSSANPRKFSEKIAIQQRKLNEEQSAFQQIMHEVHTITRFPTPVAAQAMGAPNASWSQRVVGSLPNVFEIAYPNQRPTYQDYGNPLVYSNQWPTGALAPQLFVSASPSSPKFNLDHTSRFNHASMAGPSGVQPVSTSGLHRGRSPSATHYHPYRTPSPHCSPGGAPSSPGATVVGFRAQSPDPHPLTPPLSVAANCPPMTLSPSMSPSAYLVPPQDSGWRRTHSDPGIHVSVSHPHSLGTAVLDQQTNVPVGLPNHSLLNSSSVCETPVSAGYLNAKVNYGVTNFRPTNVQTLSMSPNDLSTGSSQGSISTNTGSLPDLSQLPTFPGKPAQTPAGQSPAYHQQRSLYYSQSSCLGNAAPQQEHLVGTEVSASHQQRHSIQLPVQYSQGHFGAVGGACSYSGSQSDSSEVIKNQQQSFFGSPSQQQQQLRVPASSGLINQYSVNQQHVMTPGMIPPPPYHSTQTQMMKSPVPHAPQCDVFSPSSVSQQPLSSPNSSKIPNIILTGPCETNLNISTNTTGYIDPAVAVFSSDLRLSLDPSDLETLQLLGKEHDIIDAASEDALRRDRI